MSSEIVARCPITIRAGTMEDIPFIDALQKKHSNMVGFLQHAALEGKVRAGHVIIAEESDEATKRQSDEGEENSAFPSVASSLRRSVASSPIGYCIGHDQYFK